MATGSREIVVRGIVVDVIRKDIKNLHLAVYPPHGRVRVAAPERLDDEAVRLAIVSRLSWIRKRQAEFARQVRQSAREMVTGESHYVEGRRYLLDVVETPGRPRALIANNTTLRLEVRPGASRDDRDALLQRWLRARLKAAIPGLIATWEPILGVTVRDWRVRKMKTRWGSCNIDAGRIWLNLELAKKPGGCLEYVLVHELVHLLERHHNERFVALMDRFFPHWRALRDQLNRSPLAHEDWGY